MTRLADELPTLADAADALLRPMKIREPYQVWHGNNRKTLHHTHTLPSLYDQLAAAKTPGEVHVEDDTGHVHRTPQSCPPARLDAIALELAITTWAADTLWKARHRIAETTRTNLRAIVGATHPDPGATLKTLHRWVSAARIIAGWQAPPWTPDAPCPLCNHPRALRIRLLDETATCTHCREAWAPDTIGLLAEHIAAHQHVQPVDTRHLRAQAVNNRRAQEANRLALAGIPRPDLPYPCPRCGTPLCRQHAHTAVDERASADMITAGGRSLPTRSRST